MKIVNIHDFLMQKDVFYSYALVKYEDKTEVVYFVRHYNDNKPWFLESPCYICTKHEFDSNDDNDDLENWCLELADELLEPDADRKEYYEKYMEPLIVGRVLYDIDCPQVSPYLPREVEDIILITERECLFYLLGIEDQIERNKKKTQ